MVHLFLKCFTLLNVSHGSAQLSMPLLPANRIYRTHINGIGKDLPILVIISEQKLLWVIVFQALQEKSQSVVHPHHMQWCMAIHSYHFGSSKDVLHQRLQHLITGLSQCLEIIPLLNSSEQLLNIYRWMQDDAPQQTLAVMHSIVKLVDHLTKICLEHKECFSQSVLRSDQPVGCNR